MITANARSTFADLLTLPDEGPLYDILGGTAVVRNVPDDNHAELLKELFAFLLDAERAGWGVVYTSTRAVALDYPARGEAAQDVTHPDLVFLRAGREGLRGRRAIQGVPDLVVEILSATTLAEHQPGGRLWDAYARNGVPHYWLVDANGPQVRQYALQGAAYQAGSYGNPLTLGSGDLLTSPLFPGLTAPIDQIFRNVRRA